MYLSRLVIRNYRSLRDLDIKFTKGKNVIVGKNNSGKSNIMKALDLVLGESAPTYKKSDNITEADFYTFKEPTSDGTTRTNTAKELFIYCELTREAQEALNWTEINKCFGYYRYSNSIPMDALESNFDEAFEINQDVPDKRYINPKLTSQVTFQTELNPVYMFAFVFKASLNENGDINKDIRFFYRIDATQNWTMAFSAPIRNELLQSAVIPSFRDPQNQLRLNAWTWYGKLIKHLTKDHPHQEPLRDAFNQVKKVADEIFNGRTGRNRGSK